MSIIIPANSAAGGAGYQVDNSCRFNSGSSDSLTRTSTAGNKKTWTFSFWLKRSKLDVLQFIAFSDVANYFRMRITSGNVFEIFDSNTNKTWNWYPLLRDTSAWYHLVLRADSTDGTNGNRLRLYINGTLASANTVGSIPLNYDFSFNQGGLFNIAEFSSNNYLDGYLAETILIDGSALAPDSFGEFDEDSGIWKPIDVSGLTFGDEGFYLDFEDSGALGADVSGNSNNFTVNNLTAIDQTTDTPTNNFATLNVLDGASMAENATFSQGNTTVVCSGTDYTPYGTTIGVSKGKWYAEFKANANMGDGIVGVFANYSGDLALTRYADSYGWYNASGGNIKTADSNMSGGASVGTYATNDIIQIALDLDNNKLHFNKNNTGWLNSGNPATNAGGYAITDPDSTSLGFYFMSAIDWGGGVRGNWSCNFGNGFFGTTAVTTAGTNASGNGIFEYDVPTGFTALSTKGLNL